METSQTSEAAARVGEERFRVVAESIRGGFRRIQCTPDLLPSDIIGTQIYDSAAN